MPPQINFTQEDILTAAFNIVRKEGLEALSARRIAQELNCSTHPIYRAYQAMNELEAAIIRKAGEFVMNFLFTPDAEADDPFLSMGLRYLQFAKEEKELFKLIFLSGKVTLNLDQNEYPVKAIIAQMKQSPYLQPLSDTQLRKIWLQMMIFTHGLSTLAWIGSLENPREFIMEYLHQIAETVIRRELEQAGISPADLENCKPGGIRDNQAQ
jgi:AcrR family transcriptional regulator